MNSIRDIEWRYYLNLFIYWFSTGLPMPLIVLFMQARGLDLFQIGIVTALYSITIVILELPTGGLADAIGRKPVTLLAYAFIALHSAILLFAFSFEMFVVCYVIYGVGRALSSGALDAWFLDAIKAADPDVEIQPKLARSANFVLLGLGLGTLAGGGIAQFFSWLPADGSAILTPTAMPILIALILKSLLLFITMIMIHEDRSSLDERSLLDGVREVPVIIKTGFRLVFSNAVLLLMLLGTFVTGVALMSLENLWQPRFDLLLGDMAGKSALLGLIMGGTFLVGMIGNMLATMLSRWMGQRYALVAIVGEILKVGAFIGLVVFVDPILAAATFWLAYFGLAIGTSPKGAIVNEEIPSKQRSSMLSIFSLVTFVGAAVGSVGLGYVAQSYSIPNAWIVSAVLVGLSIALYIAVDGHLQRSKTA